MKWWEYLMIWRWVGDWWAETQERRRHERQVENKFKALLDEAEENRGDMKNAVQELRDDRERRQAASFH